jgi:2,4-dienoyl-CoA reductase (NADPH2)
VVLLEAREALGGGLALWATLPGREFFQRAVDWWASELAHLGVEVRTGTEATADTVLAERPDAVIVATGSRYTAEGRSGFLDNEVPGHGQSFVHRPEDVLIGGLRPRGKVVIIDGEGIHTAVGIAEILAGAGATVELVSSGFAPVGPSVMGTWEAGFVVRRLKAAGVTMSTQTWVRSIGEGTVTLFDVFTGEERTVDVEAVILSTSRESQDALADLLDGQVKQLFTIGDALAVRSMAAATFDGQMFARMIGEPDAPNSFEEAYWRPTDPAVLPRPAAAQFGS